MVLVRTKSKFDLIHLDWLFCIGNSIPVSKHAYACSLVFDHTINAFWELWCTFRSAKHTRLCVHRHAALGSYTRSVYRWRCVWIARLSFDAYAVDIPMSQQGLFVHIHVSAGMPEHVRCSNAIVFASPNTLECVNSILSSQCAHSLQRSNETKPQRLPAVRRKLKYSVRFYLRFLNCVFAGTHSQSKSLWHSHTHTQTVASIHSLHTHTPTHSFATNSNGQQ